MCRLTKPGHHVREVFAVAVAEITPTAPLSSFRGPHKTIAHKGLAHLIMWYTDLPISIPGQAAGQIKMKKENCAIFPSGFVKFWQSIKN